MGIICTRSIVGLAAFAFVGCSGAHSDSETAVSACGESSVHSVAATIYVTPSSNTSGVNVRVFCDGSAERTLEDSPGGNNTANTTPKVFSPGSPEVSAFLADLDSVGDVSAIPTASCSKPASFGTTTRISALDKSNGDLECLDSPSASQAALANDCQILVRQ
jgi:hypothetical protein